MGTAVLGAGRWGQLDLAGNIEQWTVDTPSNDELRPYLDPCADCAFLPPPAQLYGSPASMVRGGYYTAWLSEIGPMVAAGEVSVDPSPILGFRCARAP